MQESDAVCRVCKVKLSQHEGKQFCKKPNPSAKPEAKAKAKGGPASRNPQDKVTVVGEGRDYLNLMT